MRRTNVLLGVFLVGAMLAVTGSVRAAATCGGDPDFDGDGRADLAAGVPGQDVGGSNSAGAVHIMYGSSAGVTATGDQVFTQDSSGMADDAVQHEFFGWAVAAGDFDGDGRDDLAVGVPGQVVSGNSAAGAVHILYGSSAGLTASGDQVFTQDTSGMADEAGIIEGFGRSVAACDFDGDGRDDLAVGVPDQTVGGDTFAGAIHVIYGSSAGLTASGDQVFTEDTSGMADDAEPANQFGAALSAGDFDGDGRGDLAVGVPLEAVGVDINAGAVHVIYGSSTGLTASGDQVFTEDTSGMADDADEGDRFGRALSTGDFDGDGRDDLAVGVPFEVVGVAKDAGAVHVIYGSSTGLTASGDQIFSQDTSGIADDAEQLDEFGLALSAGDFDGDGRDDLAVGIPFEMVSGGPTSAGAVHVIYGSSSGLTASGDQFFTQNTSGVADAAEENDNFGSALSASDFDGDGRDDLAVGIEREDVSGDFSTGAVHVLFGSSTGVSASGDQFLHQDATDIEDAADTGEYFGGAVPGSPFQFFDD